MKMYEVNIKVVVEAESENDAQERVESVVSVGMKYAMDMECQEMTVKEID
jgi:hypothetical protein